MMLIDVKDTITNIQKSIERIDYYLDNVLTCEYEIQDVTSMRNLYQSNLDRLKIEYPEYFI